MINSVRGSCDQCLGWVKSSLEPAKNSLYRVRDSLELIIGISRSYFGFGVKEEDVEYDFEKNNVLFIRKDENGKVMDPENIGFRMERCLENWKEIFKEPLSGIPFSFRGTAYSFTLNSFEKCTHHGTCYKQLKEVEEEGKTMIISDLDFNSLIEFCIGNSKFAENHRAFKGRIQKGQPPYQLEITISGVWTDICANQDKDKVA